MKINLIAGLSAGAVLAVVLVIYFLIRGKAFIQMLKSADADMSSMVDKGLFWMFLGGFFWLHCC